MLHTETPVQQKLSPQYLGFGGGFSLELFPKERTADPDRDGPERGRSGNNRSEKSRRVPGLPPPGALEGKADLPGNSLWSARSGCAPPRQKTGGRR